MWLVAVELDLATGFKEQRVKKIKEIRVNVSTQTGRNSLKVPYDMEYGFDSVEETEKKRQQCELVPPPKDDPLYGKEGPVTQLWKRD